MSAVADSFFVDTNVILYFVTPHESVKHECSRRWLASLWSTGAGRLSWQVLHEFYANAIRKVNLPVKDARTAVEGFMQWNPSLPSPGQLQRAWHWCDKAKVNFWDAMIVAAAEQSGCRWLLSEDFQPGQRFGPVTVVSPFERSPAEFGLA